MVVKFLSFVPKGLKLLEFDLDKRKLIVCCIFQTLVHSVAKFLDYHIFFLAF